MSQPPYKTYHVTRSQEEAEEERDRNEGRFLTQREAEEELDDPAYADDSYRIYSVVR